MWRPEDWKNPYFPEPYPELSVLVKIEQQAGYNTLARAAYEAGADAMLGGLINQTSHPQEVRNSEGKRLGILVFIPDEEVSDARPTG